MCQCGMLERDVFLYYAELIILLGKDLYCQVANLRRIWYISFRCCYPITWWLLLNEDSLVLFIYLDIVNPRSSCLLYIYAGAMSCMTVFTVLYNDFMCILSV